MTTRAATLEAGPEYPRPDYLAPAAATKERGGAMKFNFASGSRPLDGYVIKRGIGRGGFGEVYFATSDAGKEVALKHIERNLEVELRGVGHCLNLKHPNLIDLYDVRYDDQGDAWVVMEFVAGSSLKDVVDRHPTGLPLAQVNFWFRGIAAAVGHLHEHGIVHRDLKPGNIFEDGGYVKIGDYGLSKFISTSRRSGQTESVGTFHYMAPEIGKGVYGKEIDIYALGIVLYELITGRTPFDGESSQEIIMKHLTADPDLSKIPQPYRWIIQKALQKDPAKRFSSTTEMVAALRPPVRSVGNAGGHVGNALRGVPPASSSPLYIEDESAGIEFGPLQVHPEHPPANRAQAQPGQPLRALQAPHADAEPIAAAVQDGWHRFSDWWNHGPVNTPLKVALLIGAAFVAAFHGAWLLTWAIVLASFYLVYLGGRAVTAPFRIRRAARLSRPMPVLAAAAPMVNPQAVEQQARQCLAQRSTTSHAADLSGSMLRSAFIAGVLTVLLTAVGGDALLKSPHEMSGPLWMWIMTTLGAWLVLGAGKVCERSRGERMKRRLGMLGLGLVLGAIAFGLSQYLMVSFAEGSVPRAVVRGGWTRAMYGASGLPLLPAFLAYFGALFFTISWWKQSDPFRGSRLKIAPILLAVLAAWIWQLALPFPQPWGFMLVAAISITTQLAAPWVRPAERARLGSGSPGIGAFRDAAVLCLIGVSTLLSASSSLASQPSEPAAEVEAHPAESSPSAPDPEIGAPLDTIEIPPGRPAWINQSPNLIDRVQTISVASGPYALEKQARRALDAALVEATREYIADQLGPEAAKVIRYDAQTLKKRFVKPDNTYHDVARYSVGPMHEYFALLELDPSFRKELDRRWKKVQASERVTHTGVAAGASLVGLTLAFGLLRWRAARRQPRSP